MKHQLMIAHGRVQGVGFRWGVHQFATSHRINGTVRNCPDGTVEINVQATEQEIAKLTLFIQHGPTPYAKVTKLDVKDLPVDETLTTFWIR